MKRTRMYVSDTGKQINFLPLNAQAHERESIAHIHVDHDVGAVYGIQGTNFFRALYEHIDDVFKICKYFTGHIWLPHVDIYRHIGFTVYVHHECEIDGQKVAWVIVSKSSPTTDTKL